MSHTFCKQQKMHIIPSTCGFYTKSDMYKGWKIFSLTLRLLMSYTYIYIYMERLFLMFLDHTQRRSTVSRTPLDE